MESVYDRFGCGFAGCVRVVWGQGLVFFVAVAGFGLRGAVGLNGGHVEEFLDVDGNLENNLVAMDVDLRESERVIRTAVDPG